MSGCASATLFTPKGTEVHLIGVSHTSALYGKLAHEAITSLQPDVVVLEVDEARLREQARRAQLWINENDRRGIVKPSLQPYLSSGSLWAQLQALANPRAAYCLNNEGAALVEGGIYGSEVILAAAAAHACGSAIVPADRSKALSNVRLRAAVSQQQLRAMEALPDDDWALLTQAAALAAHNLAAGAAQLLAPFCKSDAATFAEQLHPIFMLADAPQYYPVLQDVGCKDTARVAAALQRLMQHGSQHGAAIESADLALVQDAIARIEHRKHVARRSLFSQPCAGTQGPASATVAPPATCCTTGDNMPLLSSVRCSEAELQAVQQLHQDRDGSAAAGAGGSAAHRDALSGLGLGSSLAATIRSVWDAVTGSTGAAASRGCRADVFAQWCWRGAGNMHSFDLLDHVSYAASGAVSAASSAASTASDAAASAATAAADAAAATMTAMTPYYRTTVFERDSILAHRIRAVAESDDTRRVVAVVGANHLPGILRNWDAAHLPEARLRCAEYLTMPPRSAGPTVDRAAEEVQWKREAVEHLATGMEVAAIAGAAYVPWWVLGQVVPGPAKWVPLAASGALAAASTACGAGRQIRIAQLVQNLAAHQDAEAMRTMSA